jgi:hypothetical protein
MQAQTHKNKICLKENSPPVDHCQLPIADLPSNEKLQLF